jgi:uncharacterized membrane protein YkoI
MLGHTKLTLIAFAVAASGTAVYAANTVENDAMAIGKAKISLNQAITAAEQHTNGKAARAEFERSKQHGWVYDVEVVSGTKVLDVKVDADKGSIISSNEDKADRDNDHDEKD